jgi:hypothetical protein
MMFRFFFRNPKIDIIPSICGTIVAQPGGAPFAEAPACERGLMDGLG